MRPAARGALAMSNFHCRIALVAAALLLGRSDAVKEILPIELNDLLRSAGGRPVIVDFYSQSCGPCYMIAQVIKKLSKEFAGRAYFVKIDVGGSGQTASQQGVRSHANISGWLTGEKKHQFSGAGEHSLHEWIRKLVEQGLVDKSDAPIFATHHKSGTVLAHVVINHCLPSGAAALDQHWGRHLKIETHSSRRVVHFMRDLLDLAVSGYLYHRDKGERWTRADGSAAALFLKMTHDELDELGASPEVTESYTHFLQRTPVDVGMRVEVLRMRGLLKEVETGFASCLALRSNCTTVCMGDFMTRHRETWEAVFKFIELPDSSVDWKCMQSFDYEHAVANKSSHITSSQNSLQTRNKLRKVVARFDKEKLGGRISRLSKRNPCRTLGDLR